MGAVEGGRGSNYLLSLEDGRHGLLPISAVNTRGMLVYMIYVSRVLTHLLTGVQHGHSRKPGGTVFPTFTINLDSRPGEYITKSSSCHWDRLSSIVVTASFLHILRISLSISSFDKKYSKIYIDRSQWPYPSFKNIYIPFSCLVPFITSVFPRLHGSCPHEISCLQRRCLQLL